MLSHTRNRQSRWIKVTEAFKDKAVAAKVKAELTTDLSLRTQTHSDKLHAADEKCHVKRHKSLIRNANWTEPIALRNVLKCPTRHTLQTIRFWHFSSAALIVKKLKKAVLRHRSVNE